ncbi:MAG TPA: hypothetical protein PKX13_13325 [Acidiphilium sp.]|nr:hypothetical protein [Acidiphilium sp.]
MPPPPDGSFAQVLREGVSHFAEQGFSSQDELDAWLLKLRLAAQRGLISDDEVRQHIKRHMGALYDRLIERGKIVDMVPGVSRYTLAMVKPQLRAELDRRIMFSADYIRLRKTEAVEKTLQRFAGWSTSIPKGGATHVDRREAVSDIAKTVRQIRYEWRRVAIDQGHKLVSNVADIVAREAGAIAAIWHSHWRQAGYDYRKDHKERDGRVYAIRGNWAAEQGLMKVGAAGYLDDITQPAQEPYCRCYAQYVSNLRKLPDDMLTEKGRKALEAAQAA